MEINKKALSRFALILATGLIIAFAFRPIAAGETISTQPALIEESEPPSTPVAVPVPKPADDILKKIAWCESKNRQFNADGSVHMGEINPQDTGKYQINEHYHLEASKALGMDIYTLAGNTAYANYLFKTQGTTPWNWSKGCWSDPDRVWTEKAGEYWSK